MKPRNLDDFGSDYRLRADGQMLFQCPACDSRRYVALVDPVNGLWHCSRCDEGGRVQVPANPESVRRRLAAHYMFEPETWKPIEEWPGRRIEYSEYGEPICMAAQFLSLKYGIDGGLAHIYGLLRDGNRITIPYTDRFGDVIYYSGRAFDGAQPKYKHMEGRHPLYVPDWVTGFSPHATFNDIVLVEGVFDAIKLHAATGLHAVALGGKSMARYLLHSILALQPRNIKIALDSDATAAAIKLRNILVPFVDNIQIIRLPDGQDPGSMEFGELREAFK